jgi:dTDP-6-deoxy-L-talose 4-dehydrogenase (NAD+)
VVTALADLGHEVTAITRPGSRREVDPRARVCEVDVLERHIEAEEVFGAVPDVVVHLAWSDGFRHNARSHVELLSAHFRFLTAMADQGVKQIAALGTMHEIGYWEGPIDASTPTTPLTLYGVAKDALRRGLEVELGSKVILQWLRCYYIYGDDRNNQSIFTRILAAADEGKTTFPFTTGTSKYDFILVEQLGRQIAAVASQTVATGIINCCSGNPVSLAEQVEEFIATNNVELSLEYGAFPDRPYDSPAVWGDATVIREIMASAEAGR